MKTTILGTGLTGLVGSRITEFLSNAYDFSSIDTDILNKDNVQQEISLSGSNIVLHLAAKTNVDGCELDKEIDQNAISSNDFAQVIGAKTAWAVNVLGTKNIVEACQANNKKLIYISTDFVFDGTKKAYAEDDKPNPINWYAKTKYEGEKVIQSSGLDHAIIRLSYPYRAYFERNDFARGIIQRLRNRENLRMITDHIMTPTFIDDVANAVDVLVETKQSGIFHVVGSEAITPFNAAIKIAEVFNLDESLISKTTRKDYFFGKAQRPFCLNLKNDKITRLGIEMSSFEKGLREVRKQIEIINQL